MKVCATKSAMRVVCDGQRIVMHKKLRGPRGSYSTNPDHMPGGYRDFAEWSGERFRKWAKEAGPACAGAIGSILSSRAIKQQSRRSCRVVMALADRHGRQELERACAKALSYSPKAEPQDHQGDHC